MKWLALLLFIACGQHEVPQAGDLGDADGDQIYNKLEIGKDKYIAQVEEIPEIKGVLTFTQDQDSLRTIRLEFTNRRDLLNDIYKILTHSNTFSLKEEHFSEWTRLRFSQASNGLDLKESEYEVDLYFEASDYAPTSLNYKSMTSIKALGTWKQRMKLILSNAELSDLLMGKAHFQFSSRWLERPVFGNKTQEEVLKKKTYRVFFHDGEQTKVLYVSKELDFQQLMEMLNVGFIQSIEEQKDLISPININLKTTWYRDLGEDKVLVVAPLNNIVQSYINSTEQKSFTLIRENGKSSKTINISKPSFAKMYLLIDGEFIRRSFQDVKESEKKFTRRGNMRRYFDCNYIYRKATNTPPELINWNEIWEAIELKVDGKLIEWSDIFLENQTDAINGPKYILGIKKEGENVSLKLKNRSPETYIATGRISSQVTGYSRSRACQPIQNTPLNTEAKLEMNIEAYIEKI